MLETIGTSFVTFFVVLDPVAVAPLFIALTAGYGDAERRAAAGKGTFIAAITLLVFAVGGEFFLRGLGIGLPAFRIAGGALLFLLAIEMLFAHQSGLRSTTSGEESEAARRSDISVFPLAIPLIAGPGAMTSAILLVGLHRGDLLAQGAVIAVMFFVLSLTFGMLRLSSRIMGLLGVTGVNVVSRVFGSVLAALAAQYVIDGIATAFGLSEG
jgi:multiple antibiotic resistance protein